MRSDDVAENVDLSFADFQKLGNDILPRLDMIRNQDEIYWSVLNNAWIVTGHEELLKAASGDLPLSCERLVQVTVGRIPVDQRAHLLPNVMRYMPNWIINFDPPDHTRLRKLVVAALNRKVLNALRPFIEERVNIVLNALAANPQTEFNEQIARELTGSIILKLIGLPLENLKRLRDWGNAFLEAAGNPNATQAQLLAMDAAMVEMNVMLSAEIDLRRRHPQADLLTALAVANEDGDRLSTDEMLGALHVLVIAGHDSTMNTTTLGLATLANNPEFWEYMYRHPDETQVCVQELMRKMAMMTSQSRFVAADFEWNGKQLKRGQVVFLMLAAGNRDPRVFPSPDLLDPKRATLDRSLVFNPGLHHCIGHAMAKLQLGIFFEQLVKRFAGAELLDERLAFLPGIAFRGLYHLNVRMRLRELRA